MRALAFLLCSALVGCAAPTTGVVQLSDGLRKVTRQDSAGAFHSPEKLKAEAVQEASTSCGKEGKKFRLIDITQRSARPFGGWPEAEVLFRCE
jgi:hypothetical protein